jgi:hypothetical protein
MALEVNRSRDLFFDFENGCTTSLALICKSLKKRLTPRTITFSWFAANRYLLIASFGLSIMRSCFAWHSVAGL